MAVLITCLHSLAVFPALPFRLPFLTAWLFFGVIAGVGEVVAVRPSGGEAGTPSPEGWKKIDVNLNKLVGVGPSYYPKTLAPKWSKVNEELQVAYTPRPVMVYHDTKSRQQEKADQDSVHLLRNALREGTLKDYQVGYKDSINTLQQDMNMADARRKGSDTERKQMNKNLDL